MDIIMSVSEVRNKLPSLVKRIRKERKNLIITKNGRPAAVLITPEEFETLEIMADKKLLSSIARAQEDIENGRICSHKDVFKNV
jgi:prevent-host-death family protein